jgi:hypothetical protein
MSNQSNFPDTMNGEYVNCFVAEYIPDECVGHNVDDGPSFATWCVGPVKDGIFYGIQVSSSSLLPDDTEAIIVDLKECSVSDKPTNNMPEYFLDLEVGKRPRKSSKLRFQLRAELPADIRLGLIQAQDAHRNFCRAILNG